MECELTREILGYGMIVMLANLIVASALINNLINIKMITHIYHTRRKHNSLKEPESKRRAAVRDRNFAFTAIGLNLTCFIVRLPFAIALISCAYLNLKPAQVNMIFTILLTLALVDTSGMFFINMCVNQLFRQVFLEMIGVRAPGSVLVTPSSDSNLAIQLSAIYGAQASKLLKETSSI